MLHICKKTSVLNYDIYYMKNTLYTNVRICQHKFFDNYLKGGIVVQDISECYLVFRNIVC